MDISGGSTPSTAAYLTRVTTDLVIAASGAQGQWLFVVPKSDLAVAINADIPSGPDPALSMLFGTILPAMR